MKQAFFRHAKNKSGGHGPPRLCGIPVRPLERFIVSRNAEQLYLFVLTQFPRESATRFSRENRFTLFLELL
ncbi:hypothetical protein NKH74_03775 [Mesorhizobium sp. M0933]|uniref:hypothetical protein n=1 Tax=Mesorhizobium sp. M0933 TaxID=2957030 RepID=UPI0033367C85